MQTIEQQGGCQLGRGILNRRMALIKAWQQMDGDCLDQLDTHLTDRFRLNTLRIQCRQISCNGMMLQIDPQAHGRRTLRGLQHSLPILRMIVLQTLDPPCRVVPLRRDIGFCLGQQTFAFTQKST